MRHLPLVVALVVLGLVGPDLASAAQPSGLGFSFEAGHGYRVTLQARQDAVGLTIARLQPKLHRGAVTTYIARGAVSPRSVRATFGKLGRVSMRFRPSGKPSFGEPHFACRGPDRETIQPGAFTGTLRFRGEGGYIAFDKSRVGGKRVTPVQLHCLASATASTSGDPSHGPRTRLLAGFRSGPRVLQFSASTRVGEAARYLAVSEDVKGGLGFLREVFARGPSDGVKSDPRLSSATIEPPVPFSGTAALQRAANGARSWTGSLAVSFLGDPGVPLTGPEFKTSLSRGF